MKPFIATAAAVLLVTTAAAAAFSAHADTQTPAQRYFAATALLDAKLGGDSEFKLPTDDAESRQALADIKSAMADFGTPAFPVDGFATFQSVCTPLYKLPSHYLMAGTPKDGTLSEAQKASNGDKYQDQMMPLITSGVKCVALHMPWFTQMYDQTPEAARTPDRMAGIHQMQEGFGQALEGVAEAASADNIHPANALLAMDTMANYGDAIAGILSVAQRKALKTKIDLEAPGLAKAYPAQYAAIAKTLARTDCTSMCTAP